MQNQQTLQDEYFLLRESQNEDFKDYILNEETHDTVQKLFESTWKPESLLKDENNKFQEKPQPTLNSDILILGGVSIANGLKFVQNNVTINGLINKVSLNGQKGKCIGLQDPDKIYKHGEFKFVVEINNIPYIIKECYLTPELRVDKYDILEIFSGNRYAANLLIKQMITTGIEIHTLISTDIIDYACRDTSPLCDCILQFDHCNPPEAVKNHGRESNVLLMISAPPFPNPGSEHEVEKAINSNTLLGCSDYYAISAYIKQTLDQQIEGKIIIFVGELGAGDGTTGIYNYLMKHNHLDLVYTNRIDYNIFPFPFGAGVKYVYIFRIKLN